MCINYVNTQDFLNAQPRSCFNGFSSMNAGRPCAGATARYPVSGVVNPPISPDPQVPSNPQPPPNTPNPQNPQNPAQPPQNPITNPSNPSLPTEAPINPALPGASVSLSTRFITLGGGQDPSTLGLTDSSDVIIIVQTAGDDGNPSLPGDGGNGANGGSSGSGSRTLRPTATPTQDSGTSASIMTNTAIIVPVAVGVMAAVILFPLIAFFIGRSKQRRLIRERAASEKDVELSKANISITVAGVSDSGDSDSGSSSMLDAGGLPLKSRVAMAADEGGLFEGVSSNPLYSKSRRLGGGGPEDSELFHGIGIEDMNLNIGVLTADVAGIDKKGEPGIVEVLPGSSGISEGDSSGGPSRSQSTSLSPAHRIVSVAGLPVRRRVVLNIPSLTAGSVSVVTSPTIIPSPAPFDQISSRKTSAGRVLTKRSIPSVAGSDLKQEVSLSPVPSSASLNSRLSVSLESAYKCGEVDTLPTSVVRDHSADDLDDDGEEDDVVVDVIGKPVEWSVDEVVMYLTRMGVPDHIAVAFRDHSIDGRNFLELTAEDLEAELNLPDTIVIPPSAESNEALSLPPQSDTLSSYPTDNAGPSEVTAVSTTHVTLDIHATVVSIIQALRTLQKEAEAIARAAEGRDEEINGGEHQGEAIVPPQVWEVERVCDWLGDVVGASEEVVGKFRANRVTGQKLLNLSVQDMRQELNILPFGIRTTIHSAIALLRSGDPVAILGRTAGSAGAATTIAALTDVGARTVGSSAMGNAAFGRGAVFSVVPPPPYREGS
ncbi:hypothetical protein HDU67_005254 [Dinochytrium kinnereticum]|nr:hypothetical protein HDU67_005254 [Dinochytrium kinnereticum]